MLGADPVYASAAPDRFAAALERVPLVVSFASIADDSALHADWILPDAHFLERWDLQTTPPGVPFPVVSLSQPALAQPLHDVRPVTEVLLELARRVGTRSRCGVPVEGPPDPAPGRDGRALRARARRVMGPPSTRPGCG